MFYKYFLLIFAIILSTIQTSHQKSVFIDDYDEALNRAMNPKPEKEIKNYASNVLQDLRTGGNHFGDLYVKIAVFVDQFLEMRFSSDKDLTQFVSSLIYASQIIYNRDNIRGLAYIKFVVVYYGKVDNNTVDTHEGDISPYLSDFCDYQKDLKQTKAIQTKGIDWNAAILLSGLNLYNSDNIKSASGLVQKIKAPPTVDKDLGLSYQNTICQDSGCAVCEARDLPVVNTIVHELGHIFNMAHDGEKVATNCPPDQYIMSPNFGYGIVNEWSECSADQLKTTLERLENSNNQCLLNKTKVVSNVFDFSKQSLPGVAIPVDKQCQFIMGPKYESKTDGMFEKDICDVLYCKHIYDWFTHFGFGALEGTFCGSKWSDEPKSREIKHYCRAKKCDSKLTPN